MRKPLAEITLDEGNVDFSVYTANIGKLDERKFKRVMQVLDILKTQISSSYEMNRKKQCYLSSGLVGWAIQSKLSGTQSLDIF